MVPLTTRTKIMGWKKKKIPAQTRNHHQKVSSAEGCSLCRTSLFPDKNMSIVWLLRAQHTTSSEKMINEIRIYERRTSPRNWCASHLMAVCVLNTMLVCFAFAEFSMAQSHFLHLRLNYLHTRGLKFESVQYRWFYFQPI